MIIVYLIAMLDHITVAITELSHPSKLLLTCSVVTSSLFH